MIPRFSPGRLTLAIVAALAVLLFAPAAGLMPSTVSADVGSISSGGVIQVSDNTNVTITVVAEDDDGTLTISTNDGDDLLTLNSCSGAGTCPAGNVTGSGTSSVSITTATIDGDPVVEPLTVSLTLRADCDSGTEVIQVSASQPGGVTRSVNITCGPNNDGDTNITIHKDSDFSNASFRFFFSVSNGTCVVSRNGNTVASGSSGDFFLSDNQSAHLDCTDNATVTVTEDIDSSLVNVSGCSNEAGVTIGSRSVRVNTSQSDSNVSCTFNNNVSINPASIQLSAANLTPNCGTSTTISAYVINSNGGVAANGTVVTFSATPGVLSQTTASTVNGVATVTYTAPVNFANLVTILAYTGSASAQGQLRVVCVVAAPVQPAPPPQPTVVSPAAPRPAQPLVVAPPSAGDGGLLDKSGFSWTLFAGIILAAAISMGASFVLQREKAE